MFCFVPRFPLSSKCGYLTILFLVSRMYISVIIYPQISLNISRYRQISFDWNILIFITKYHRNLWQLNSRCYQKTRQVKQKIKVSKTSLMRTLVLKQNKLKIKIVENKTSIDKSYLYLFVTHLFVALLLIS